MHLEDNLAEKIFLYSCILYDHSKTMEFRPHSGIITSYICIFVPLPACSLIGTIFISLCDIKKSLSYVTMCVAIYVVPSFLTNFGALYLTEFSTNFGQILDSNSYDQA